MNRSKEHVIPKSIGGRKTIEDFICTNCNNTAGTECDNELYEQLKPFCTMLGIKRSGKDNQPVEIRGADGKEFILNPDASIAIPHLIRNERAVGDKIEVIIQTKSMKEAKRQLTQEAAKRLHLDVEKIISNASSLRDQIQAPLRMSLPLFLSGAGAGRSIVKSCLALAYEAGVSIDDCEVARRILRRKS